MSARAERFLVDEDGNRVGVLLEIEAYERLLEELEELDEIRAYDAVKADPGERIPFSQALDEIERTRR